MAYADDGHNDNQTERLGDRCGLARAAKLIGDRWTLLIIREALYGVTRFDQMQAELGAPRSVLSKRLKHLCDIGVLTRRPYRESGQRQRHHYALTSKGMGLALPLFGLMEWGAKYYLGGDAPSRLVERKSGAPCHVSLVSEDGTSLSLAEVKFSGEKA